MGKVIPLTKGTPREILEEWLEKEEDIEEIMILGKKGGLHRWATSNMKDTVWWIGMLAHVQAELNFEAIMGMETDYGK